MKRPFSKRFARKVLRLLARLLLRGFTRTRALGLEHVPPAGPVIIAGNHAGLMELVLLAAFLPVEAEFIGSGDIPLDPRFAWLADLWGYIPVKRGVLDRAAIHAGSLALKNGGALVIFPEGGIWNPGAMQPHTGVALFSLLTRSPVLPVGMSGTQGALAAVLRRPKLQMTVGTLIPPVTETPPDGSRKEHLQRYAGLVMERIRALLPDEAEPASPRNEQYTFDMERGGGGITQSQDVPVAYRPALGKFLLHPIILD
ncbi:MAG: lysophospholipid acyltransferase family protein, partial [Anaerolineaceae bacterium]